MSDSIYIKLGSIVQVKQDIPFKPKMVVYGEERSKGATGAQNRLVGLKTFWFDKDQRIQLATFSTKDLELCENE